MSSQAQRVLDVAAVGLSALCLLHCLALPLVAAAAPVFATAAEAEWVHWAVVITAAPISLGVFLLGAVHGDGFPLGLLIAVTGLGAMFAALFAPHEWETPLSVAGGVLVATAHVLNWRRRTHRH